MELGNKDRDTTQVLGRARMAELLRLVLLAAVLSALAACFPQEQNGAERPSADARQVHRETTAAPEQALATEGETSATPEAPVKWDYVALGDSLAVGVGARRGYVDRYGQYLRSDTGARIEVANLGRSGQTSPQLLHALRNDASVRKVLGRAEVVTFNIGINDLGHASRSYENGSCGGLQNERCLYAAVEEVEGNWDAIIVEILSLRSTHEAIIRTAGLGYTPRVDPVFEPYLVEVNRHIAASAADEGIPYAEVRLGEEEMSPDGVHPNGHGYGAIASRMRELGYDPLGPR